MDQFEVLRIYFQFFKSGKFADTTTMNIKNIQNKKTDHEIVDV